MSRRIWIVEDGSSRERLLNQYRECNCIVCPNLAAALEAIDKIEDDDIVTVDSQLPRSEGESVDGAAGKTFILELRRRGSKCRILWHSESVLDEAFGTDLAVQNAPESGLDHLEQAPLPIPHNIVAWADAYAGMSRSPIVEFLGGLLIALEAYLFAHSVDHLAGTHDLSAPNSVIESLGPDKARALLVRSSHSWNALRGRLDDCRWWFRNGILTLRMACPGNADVLAWLERGLPYKEANTSGNMASLCTEGRRHVPPGNGQAQSDSRAKAYFNALAQLARFYEACATALRHTDHVLCTQVDADQTCRALRLILLTHFPFGYWSQTILDHRLLSHFGDYRILFQKPGAASKSGGQPAITQKVLRGEVPPGTYPNTEALLARWSSDRARITANIEALTREMLLISPSCFKECREQFGGHNIFHQSDLFGEDDEVAEQLFDERLNCDIEYFEMPPGYVKGNKTSAVFEDEWFRDELERHLEDEQPIALIVLDLLFGNQDIRNREKMAGVRFRDIVRRHNRLRNTPVIFASNLPRSSTSDLLKDFEASHKCYIQKEIVNLPDSLLCRAIEWGHIADPELCAYSGPMRAIAQRLRSLALQARTTNYESSNGTYPTPILFTGEFGSGKGWLAKRFHAMSTRRGKPIEELQLTGASGPQDMTAKMFGTGPHEASGIAGHYVHIPTGALLKDGAALLKIEDMKNKIVTLYEIGALQRVDVGSMLRTEKDLQNRRPEDVTLKGTLIVDELSETSEECQGKLIEVFNEGKFRPLFKSEQIPRDRCLDVWLIFLCSLDGWNRETGGVRQDLKDRLSHEKLDVPSLRERSQDVLPLAMKVLAPLVASRLKTSNPVPRQVLSDQAMDSVMDLAKYVSLRQFIRIMANLPSVSSQAKFSKDEVEEAREHAGVRLATAPKLVSRVFDVTGANGETGAGYDLETFSQLRSKYAQEALKILERELRAELGQEGTIEGLSWEHLWQRISKVRVKSNLANDGITKMLLIDREITITAALNSRLLRTLLESDRLRSEKIKEILIEFRQRLALSAREVRDK